MSGPHFFYFSDSCHCILIDFFQRPDVFPPGSLGYLFKNQSRKFLVEHVLVHPRSYRTQYSQFFVNFLDNDEIDCTVQLLPPYDPEIAENLTNLQSETANNENSTSINAADYVGIISEITKMCIDSHNTITYPMNEIRSKD